MSNDATTVVIASAARTPVGSFNGSLASMPAHELGHRGDQSGFGARQSFGQTMCRK